jgi:hypothetical protein
MASMTVNHSQVAASASQEETGSTTQEDNSDDGPCEKTTSLLGLPTWYKYLPIDEQTCEVTTVKAGDRDGKQVTDIGATGGRILLAVTEVLLRLAGLAAVGFVIWGGVQYTISQGAPDKTAKAKDTILNAVIGLAIVILAVVIVNFVSTLLS